MTSRPPKRLERWLAHRIPDGAVGGSMLGDLHEEFAALASRRGRLLATVWYVAQCLAIGGPWAAREARRTLAESLSGWGLDLRATLRSLVRTPGLAGVAVLSLGAGIGLTTAVIGVINAIWFAPLPWPEQHRLVQLEDAHAIEVCRDCSPGTSLRAFEGWQTGVAGSFERIEAVHEGSRTLRIDGVTTEVQVAAHSGGLADLLGLRTAHGRLLRSDDAAPGASTVVLSHGFWMRAFGGDLSVLGRDLELAAPRRTVVGILEADAPTLYRADLVVPLRRSTAGDRYDDRDLWVVGRLAESVALSAANTALDAYASATFSQAPELVPGWTARAVPFRTVLERSAGEPSSFLALLVLPLLVLLMASINLAAFLLARITERSRELGVRSALGAGRLRLARAGISDALVLSLLGGSAGLLFAWTGREVALAQVGEMLPTWVGFPLDLRVLGGTLALVVGAAMVAGLPPVLRAIAVGRSAGFHAGTTGRRSRRTSSVHDLLLGAQLVLGLVLVAGSTGALRSWLLVRDFDRLGFRWEGVQGVVLAAGEDPGALASRLVPLLDARPDLSRATAQHTLFLGSWGSAEAESPVRVDGAPVSNTIVPRHSMAVASGWFELHELPMRAGRTLTTADGPGAPPAAVVSEAAARRLWPDEPPSAVLDRSFTVDLGGVAVSWAVVGVSADVVRSASTGGQIVPRVYTSLAQTPSEHLTAAPGAGLEFRVVPTSGAELPTSAWVEWLSEAAPEAAVLRSYSLEQMLDTQIRPIFATALVLAAMAVLVVLLLVLGIGGTVGYRVSRARREIGVRIVLGAGAGAVVRSVAGRVGVVLGVGLLIGLAAAVTADRVLDAGGIPIGDADPAILGGVALLVSGVAILAAGVPIRRALRIDPMESLRVE